jgi:putative flippase GtrA
VPVLRELLARDNLAMKLLRALTSHPMSGQMVRYVITGSLVALVYTGTPFLLNVGLGVPVEASLPFAYVGSVTLHFFMQRHFVFRHVETFALTRREQIGRYVAMGAVQYPTTALSTALLPVIFGMPQRWALVITTVAIAAIVFVVLRGLVFHAAADAREEPAATLVTGV